jgi:hypothetical protein
MQSSRFARFQKIILAMLAYKINTELLKTAITIRLGQRQVDLTI